MAAFDCAGFRAGAIGRAAAQGQGAVRGGERNGGGEHRQPAAAPDRAPHLELQGLFLAVPTPSSAS